MGPEKVIAETVFEGFGRSKKLAEQAACIAALELYHTKRLIGGFKVNLYQDHLSNLCFLALFNGRHDVSWNGTTRVCLRTDARTFNAWK